MGALEFPRPGGAPVTADEAPMSTGERLRRLRIAAGLSQTELAGDTLSPSYVSLLEAGKRQPSSEVAAVLAKRLGCSVSMLLYGQPSERERRIDLELSYARLALSHGASADAKKRLRALLDETDLDRRVGDEAVLMLAEAYEKDAQLSEAIELLGPLFQRARRGESHLPVSAISVRLCSCCSQSGDYHRAVVIGEQALEAADAQGLRGTDDYYRLASTVMWAYHEVGDLLHASDMATALIAEVEAEGSATGQAAIYWNASLVAQTMGRLDEALYLSQRALGTISEGGTTRDLARLKIAAAELLLDADPSRAAEALGLLGSDVDAINDLGSQRDLSDWESTAALAHLYLGNVDTALALAQSAFDRVTDAEPAWHASLACRVGDMLTAAGHPGPALEKYLAALTALRQENPAGRAGARTCREIGDRLAACGAMAEAVAAYQRALESLSVNSAYAPVWDAVQRASAAARSALST